MKFKFLKYYFKHKDSVYNYFLYRLNFDKSLAEDLTSDAFLRAFKKFETYNPERAQFNTWILTISHNLLLNFYRDKKNTYSIEEMSDRGIKVKDEAYLNNLIDKLEIKLVIDKIQTLADNYAQVLVLRLVNQLSHKEISKIIGKEETNVRAIFSRGMEKLLAQFN